MKSRLWVIGTCVFVLGACGVQAPLDDAYHWEDRTSTTSTSSTSSEPSQQVVGPKPVQPTLEFTNVQDTTITVKIHR